MFSEFFGRIFSSKNYRLYSNLNSAAYMSIARSLENAGIGFRTVTRYNSDQPLKTQRDIYIKEAEKKSWSK